jgi:peptidoglycan/xylan/chitin deacetylase (PgdA/CDA1 family)
MDSMEQRSMILTFHGVGEPGRRLEAGEEQVWLDSDRFVSMLDSVADRSDVRITFDDGNASDVMHALPALRGRGLTASFFVVAGRLGEPGFLDEGDVRALAAEGMTIGCHGMHHRSWRRLDEAQLREELVEARRLLEEIVERPVTEAACPFGSYDRRVLRALRRCGYRRVYTSDRGTARCDDWLQARNTVRRDDQLASDVILSGEKPRFNALPRPLTLAVKRWR